MVTSTLTLKALGRSLAPKCHPTMLAICSKQALPRGSFQYSIWSHFPQCKLPEARSQTLILWNPLIGLSSFCAWREKLGVSAIPEAQGSNADKGTEEKVLGCPLRECGL
jgi:hypothetical protein